MISLIFSVITVQLSFTNALFNEILLALSLMFIFLLAKKLPSIPVNISSASPHVAVLNIGALRFDKAIKNIHK
jgi:hypothetical protein